MAVLEGQETIDYSIYFCKPAFCEEPPFHTKITSVSPCLSSLTPGRSIRDEANKAEAIWADASQSLYALKIITAVQSITHIALATETVTGTTEVQTAEPSAVAGHVKIRRAAALVPNITHLSDRNIGLHETHADRNSCVDRAIIGSQLHAWMVGNQTTNLTFMMYNGGGGLEVPMLAYATDNDTLHFHIQYHPPAAASNNLTVRNSDYASHAPFFAANGAGIKLSMQNVIDRKSPPASQDDATSISKAVVNDWFYNREDATHVGYEEVLTDNGWGGHVLCYIPEARRFGLNSETNMCF